MGISPIACNCIIGIPHLPNIDIVGDAEDWLSFYGSYLGNTISTLGAFAILYITIWNSRHEQKLEHVHKEIMFVQKDLAERFGKYGVLGLIRIKVTYAPTPEKLKEEATYLQTIRDKYSELAYSADFLYGGGDGYEMPFFREYKDMMNDTLGLIDELIIFYTQPWDDKTSPTKLQQFGWIASNLDLKNKSVENSAYQYLKNRVDEYQRQQNYNLL